MDDLVVLNLSQSVALVLFDWLARSSDAGAPITDLTDAERRVLWDVEANLESLLVEPLSSDYARELANASADVLK